MHLFNNNLQKYKIVSKEMSNYRNILLEYDIIIDILPLKTHYIILHTQENFDYNTFQPKIGFFLIYHSVQEYVILIHEKYLRVFFNV